MDHIAGTRDPSARRPWAMLAGIFANSEWRCRYQFQAEPAAEANAIRSA